MPQAISFSTFWASTDSHPPCPQLVACKIFAKSYIHAPSWETVGKDLPDVDRTRVFRVEDRYDSHVLTACDHGMVSEIESCLCFVRTSTRLHLVRSLHSHCGPTYHRSPSYTLIIVGRQSLYQAGGPLAQAAPRSIVGVEKLVFAALRQGLTVQPTSCCDQPCDELLTSRSVDRSDQSDRRGQCEAIQRQSSGHRHCQQCRFICRIALGNATSCTKE